ncbi:MAG: TonB-dependent receptor [Balneolaceae bacterium]
MSKFYTTLTIAIFICAPISGAQTTSTVTDSLELENVVITASKIPQSQRETTKPVIIIDRKQIEQSPGRDFSQLLNRQSGIRVNNSWGAPGENKSLFLQGGAGEHALILVDGLAIADPSGTGGAFDIRQFPLSEIERIEVIKGSQSTLYGTDAIAGVVNIITRSGGENPLGTTGQLSYGSYNTWKGNLGVNGEVNEFVNYRFSYSGESSEGISAAKDPDGTGSFGKDGITRDSFNGKMAFKPSEAVTITPSLTWSSYEGDYDAAAFNDASNTFTLDLLNPGIQIAVNQENWNLNGGYNYTITDRLFSSQFGENEFKGRFHNADVYGTYRLSSLMRLLGGINYQDSLLPGEEEISAQNVSPYATLLLKNLDGLNAELGYRLNSHSEYGTNSTVSFAPSFDLSGSVKLFASAGTGFKVPTLDELFGPFGANANLTPQKSVYYNGGVEAFFFENALKADLQYFNRSVDDVIVYTASMGFINRDRQNTSGVELSANWLVNTDIEVGGYYNYLTGELVTEDENGNRVTENNLIRKPAHSFGGTMNVQLNDRISFSLNGEYNGERKDLFFNPDTFEQEEVDLDPYTLFNLYADYEIPAAGVTFFGEVRNLFGEEFTEVYGFNTIGFSATGGLRFSL